DLLLDQAPLVDATRSLEKQALRVDRHDDVGRIRLLVDLEEEVAARPREEVIDRLLDLHADVARKVGGRDDPPLDEQLTDAFVGLPCLLHEYFVELLLCDLPVPHEQVAQPVTAVDDARVRDAPLVEVDLAE